jgi:hypothetical protein
MQVSTDREAKISPSCISISTGQLPTSARLVANCDISTAVTLSEERLIELLNKASHAGVLSQGFIRKGRERIEA